PAPTGERRSGSSRRRPKARSPLVPRTLAAPALLLAALGTALAAARPSEAEAEPEPGPIAHYERGIAALEAKDPRRAKDELSKAAAALPRDPEVLSALARADALSGDADGALRVLARVVAMGYGVGATEDPAFASLVGRAEFRALAPRIAENAKPV